MKPGVSLLEQVQGLLERTYRIPRVIEDIGRFVIGDRGYRSLYRGAVESAIVHSTPGREAKTLVRETDESVKVSVYYPDELIQCLEKFPPQKGLRDENVDAFAVLVEELDHLLCIAERVADGRPLTMFELELHANVSKHLVLARFLAGRRHRFGPREKLWLRYQLFEKGTFCDSDAAVRTRYRDAARWSVRFIDAVEPLEPAARVDAIRAFHRASQEGKVELIRELAS
jgi:hypothetical protein